MRVTEIPAAHLYEELARGDLDAAQSRQRIADISMVLAQAARHSLAATGCHPGTTLCVFVLRGGALLLPGFLQNMAHVPFCLLALKRDAATGDAKPLYCSDLPSAPMSTIVYVDCIAASGGTIDIARSLMRKAYRPAREMLVVIASSAGATRRLAGEGLEIIGLSLFEQVEGSMLTPDLGRLDAGDIMSGSALVADSEWSLVL